MFAEHCCRCLSDRIDNTATDSDYNCGLFNKKNNPVMNIRNFDKWIGKNLLPSSKK
jgi:hypothetical protein